MLKFCLPVFATYFHIISLYAFDFTLKILPANKFSKKKSHFLTKLLYIVTLFFRFPNEGFLKKHLTVCIQKQADNACDKTCRSIKVTTEPQEEFIEGDIKDEPLDISENIDAVTGEFITGDI